LALGCFSAYVVKNACLSAVALLPYERVSVPQSEFFFDRFLGTFSKKVPRENAKWRQKKEDSYSRNTVGCAGHEA
jgi:hypothetical protein